MKSKEEIELEELELQALRRLTEMQMETIENTTELIEVQDKEQIRPNED